MPGKNFSRRHFETCFPPLFFLQKNRLWTSCKGPIFYTPFEAICMKGQSLFSGKNKKKKFIKLSSSKFSQRAVTVKYDRLQSPKKCSLCGQRNLKYLKPPLMLIKVHAMYRSTYCNVPCGVTERPKVESLKWLEPSHKWLWCKVSYS